MKEIDGKEVFPAANKRAPTYDAYEKDIATVTFYFESPTLFEYLKEQRMTLLEFATTLNETEIVEFLSKRLLN